MQFLTKPVEFYTFVQFITIRNSCGKVMFSQACVNNSVHRGVVWRGGGICVTGVRARQERWPLQRTVRILLECILVNAFIFESIKVRVSHEPILFLNKFMRFKNAKRLICINYHCIVCLYFLTDGPWRIKMSS